MELSSFLSWVNRREKDSCFFSNLSGSKRCACWLITWPTNWSRLRKSKSERENGGLDQFFKDPLWRSLFERLFLSFSWACKIALMRPGFLSPYTSILGSGASSTGTYTSSRGGRLRSMSHRAKTLSLLYLIRSDEGFILFHRLPA